MALTLEHVQRQFEIAAGNYPGVEHVLLATPGNAIRLSGSLPRNLRVTPCYVRAGSRIARGITGISGRGSNTPRGFLDGWDFAHWHFLRFAELEEHDYQRENEASCILRRLTPHAVRFIPPAKRIAGHSDYSEWLLYLNLREPRNRQSVDVVVPERVCIVGNQTVVEPAVAMKGWYTTINDVFLESVSALQELSGMPPEVEAALRSVDITAKPLALLKLVWSVPSIQDWQTVPRVWDVTPKPGTLRVTVSRANEMLVKIKSSRTLLTADGVIYWNGES